MLGPAHATSGAALWLAGAALWQHTGHHVDLPVVLVGAAVCAGAALLPDLDHPGSLSTRDGATAVRAFGPLGEAVGHTLSAASLAIYNGTRGHRDPVKTGGHRTFTHTVAFAVLAGVAAWLGCMSSAPVGFAGRTWAAGQLVGLGLMWAMLHLALIGLGEKQVKRARSRWGLLGVFALSGAVTAATAYFLPPAHGYPWLGPTVAAGCLAHLAGDAITKAGVPALWPMRVRGRRWYDVALPGMLRVDAGGVMANLVVPGVLVAVGVASLAALILPAARA